METTTQDLSKSSREIAEQKLEYGYLWCVRNRRYFSALLLNLQKVWIEKNDPASKICKTMMVDDALRLYLNVDYVSGLSKESLRFCLLHELHHLVRLHIDRKGNRNLVSVDADGDKVYTWNLATDAEINSDLSNVDIFNSVFIEHDFVLPSNFGLKSGLSAEQYYDLLKNNTETSDSDIGITYVNEDGKFDYDSGANGGNKKQNNNDCEDQNIPSCSKGSEDGESSNDKDNGSDSDNGKYSHSCMAVAQDGSPLESSARQQNQNRRTESYVETILSDTAERIVHYVENTQKDKGDFPAGLLLAAKNILKPVVNWANELRVQVRSATSTVRGFDFVSYRRFSRRFTPAPDRVLMPSYVSYLPNVAVLLDTSGSMGEDDIRRALSEIDGIVTTQSWATMSDPIPVWCCDAEVYGPDSIRNIENLNLRGGGGTNMSVGLNKIKEEMPNVDIIICLTDGWTGWPAWSNDDPRLIVGLVSHATNLSDVPSSVLAEIPDAASVVLIPVSHLKTA